MHEHQGALQSHLLRLMMEARLAKYGDADTQEEDADNAAAADRFALKSAGEAGMASEF